jgi:hypothetical protein
MRKLLIASTLVLMSCGHGSNEVNTPVKETGPEKIEQYNEYVLDGCQYIVVGFGDHKWGSHKGTCTNTIHKCN